jgi:hypothetical protein
LPLVADGVGRRAIAIPTRPIKPLLAPVALLTAVALLASVAAAMARMTFRPAGVTGRRGLGA